MFLKKGNIIAYNASWLLIHRNLRNRKTKLLSVCDQKLNASQMICKRAPEKNDNRN